MKKILCCNLFCDSCDENKLSEKEYKKKKIIIIVKKVKQLHCDKTKNINVRKKFQKKSKVDKNLILTIQIFFNQKTSNITKLKKWHNPKCDKTKQKSK